MFSSRKPYSAVTVAVETLTSERYEEDDLSGIPDIVEAIKLQATGPSEAARAIRKKLKYGSAHRQLRALILLDGLIQNGGARFQRTFADEMLLERLRICGTSNLSDPLVSEKCQELFRSWANEYKNVRGLERIAALYKELPRTRKVVTQNRSKVLRETEEDPFRDDEDEEMTPAHSRQVSIQEHSSRTPVSQTPLSESSMSSLKKLKKEKEKTRKFKSKPFNLEADKETMKDCIAESSVASTNLLNALRLINREREQVSDNKAAVHYFESCKLLRRKTLRYIQYIDSEQWLGALLHANDELVTALLTFEQLDRSIDADSDSDDELSEQSHASRSISEKEEPGSSKGFAGLGTDKSTPPPLPTTRSPAPGRPMKYVEQADHNGAEDDDDPFADRNALGASDFEKRQPVWRDV